MEQTTELFWDCECEHNYIYYKKPGARCGVCGAKEESQPDSLISEVREYLVGLEAQDRIEFAVAHISMDELAYNLMCAKVRNDFEGLSFNEMVESLECLSVIKEGGWNG